MARTAGAAIGVLLALGGCTSQVSPREGQGDAQVAHETSPPSAAAASPPAAAVPTQPAAPSVSGLAFSTPNGVTWADGSLAATITVEPPTFSTAPPNQYGQPPKNGVYATFNVTAVAGNKAYSINPYDFYYRTLDGSQYDMTSGNALFLERTLPLVTLNPGEQVKGTTGLDIPAGQPGQLVYGPARRALGYWEVRPPTG